MTSAQADLAIDTRKVDAGGATDAVLDAALACVGRWGIGKTTLDDVAREAGISRATVYRLFPGGKQSLVESVAHRELVRLAERVRSEVDAASDLEDAVVVGMVAASRFVAEHQAVNYLLQHERAAILPFIAFDRLDPALKLALAALGPTFEQFCSPQVAEEVIEWATRMVVSLIFAPGTVDATESDSVRPFDRTYLMPGVTAGMSH